MTRKQALADLIAKVEAGEATQDMDGWFHLPLTVREDKTMISHMSKAWAAYEGSLDAAKALHEAVLPGWVARPRIGGKEAGVSVWRCTIENWESGEEVSANNVSIPARAWLLAILRALHSMEPAPTP